MSPSRDLRPMAFGRRQPRQIANPLCEPLWFGRRVLLEISGPVVEIKDEAGEPMAGYDDLRAAALASGRAAELVADGYLLPAPLRDTVGIAIETGMDAIPTPSERGRRLFVGSAGRKRREALENAEARRVAVPPTAPTAFVAVDLLWLDGQSLLDVPLQERKRLLDSALEEHELIRRTVVVRPPVEGWFAQWKALGFREIAFKAANSRYEPGAISRDWATAPIPRR
ncbi:MAG: hypothetical protein ACAH65_07980 [Chloroflexota bacterium]